MKIIFFKKIQINNSKPNDHLFAERPSQKQGKPIKYGDVT